MNTLTETIELKDREILDIPMYPASDGRPIARFGVALDNDEALTFALRGWRVYGDADGPYLVVRLRAGQFWPAVTNGKADIKFEPIPWIYHHEQGIICWYKEK